MDAVLEKRQMGGNNCISLVYKIQFIGQIQRHDKKDQNIGEREKKTIA